ncbi:MAG: IS3 family transposase [Azonexus sp.]
MVEQAAHHHTIERACAALMVSPSGYHLWQQHNTSPCQRRLDDVRITEQIRAVHHANYGCYGSPRIHAALRAAGETVSKHRVARLMRESGIAGKRSHRRVSTTVTDPQAQVAANLLNRRFTATAPNQKWVVDVTYLPTAQGWLYLAVVLDLFSRKVVGWATSTSFDQKLVITALKQALETRQAPALHHSDRGVQYTSLAYQQLLARNAITSSMSRTGQPYDNAVMESFFATLKEEQLPARRYATVQQAESALLRYIEGFYNRTRLHSTLGYLSPDAYERNYRQRQRALQQPADRPSNNNQNCPDKETAQAPFA